MNRYSVVPASHCAEMPMRLGLYLRGRRFGTEIAEVFGDNAEHLHFYCSQEYARSIWNRPGISDRVPHSVITVSFGE